MVWTCDEDWVKKCMEFRVDGRSLRRTWLESVEADIAELESDKEDVHKRIPNHTAYKRWSCHSGHKLL